MKINHKEIRVVPANQKHLYTITVLTRKYFPYTGFNMEAIVERMRSKRIKYYVAEYKGHTAGFVDFELLPKRIKILGLAVIEEFRGNGIGKRLFKKALNEARKAGKKQAFLLTASAFPEAQTLYRKLGFRQTGKLARKLWDREVIIMTNQL